MKVWFSYNEFLVLMEISDTKADHRQLELDGVPVVIVADAV